MTQSARGIYTLLWSPERITYFGERFCNVDKVRGSRLNMNFSSHFINGILPIGRPRFSKLLIGGIEKLILRNSQKNATSNHQDY
jgi:hypothetical protein